MVFKNTIAKGLVLLTLMSFPSACSNNHAPITPPQPAPAASENSESPEETKRKKISEEVEALKKEKLTLENDCLKYKNEKLTRENEKYETNEKRNAQELYTSGVMKSIGILGLTSLININDRQAGEIWKDKKEISAWRQLARDQGYNPKEVIEKQMDLRGTAIDYVKLEAEFHRKETQQDAEREIWKANVAMANGRTSSLWQRVADLQKRVEYTEEKIKKYEPRFSYFLETQDGNTLDWLTKDQKTIIQQQTLLNWYEQTFPGARLQYERTHKASQQKK